MNSLELKEIIKQSKLTRKEFVDRLGVSIDTLNSWVYKGKNIPKSKEKLILSVFSTYYGRDEDDSKLEEPLIPYGSGKKVPFYDIDVTSHITTSFNDIPETPSFYMDYEPFNDCDAVVNNYGDSMFPKYRSGEKLAIKQINNIDAILWGESHLVVTNSNANDMRTVKDVHPHEDVSKIILRASNPNFKGDTVVSKEDILSLFIIKGKISQNII